MKLEFTIPGPAVPDRHVQRAVKSRKTGRYVPLVARTPEVKRYMTTVALAARVAYKGKLIPHPVRVTVIFYLLRRKRSEKGRMLLNRVDEDNLKKPIIDALTGIFWKDDNIWRVVATTDVVEVETACQQRTDVSIEPHEIKFEEYTIK